MKKFLILITICLVLLCACNSNSNSASSSDNYSNKNDFFSTLTSESEENTTSSDDIKRFFCINEYTAGEPNSAGGVNCNITFWSFGDVIKYITFWVEPYNAVDDVVSCEIKNKSEIKIQYTGPTETSDPTSIVLENAWYNHTIKTVKINKVKIELTNDTVYETEDIESLLVDGIKIEYGMYGASQSAMQRIICNVLNENGITEKEFIAGLSGYMKDTIEDILNSSSKFKHIPTSIFSYIASSLDIPIEELIYSL